MDRMIQKLIGSGTMLEMVAKRKRRKSYWSQNQKKYKWEDYRSLYKRAKKLKKKNQTKIKEAVITNP